MHRSRIVQILNVPRLGKELFRQLGVGRVRMLRLGSSLAAALLDELFEHPITFVPYCLTYTNRLDFLQADIVVHQPEVAERQKLALCPCRGQDGSAAKGYRHTFLLGRNAPAFATHKGFSQLSDIDVQR